MTDLEQKRQKLAEARKDFEVRYRFLSADEGGRTGPPAQGVYRSDWSYEGDGTKATGIHMIWPIFLDQKGELVQPNEFVAPEGVAQMFIVSDDQRGFHAGRLRPGVRGYFMEGPHRVAEAVVTMLLAIAEIHNVD